MLKPVCQDNVHESSRQARPKSKQSDQTVVDLTPLHFWIALTRSNLFMGHNGCKMVAYLSTHVNRI